MAQEPPPDDLEQEEDQLSGTLYERTAAGLQGLSGSVGWLSGGLVLGGVTALVVGVALLVFFSDLETYSYIILGIGGALLLISMVVSFPTVSGAITGRQGRYSTNTVLMVAAFLGIMAVGNFLSFENNKRMDVTFAKQFALAPRTEQLLKDLEKPVSANVFFSRGASLEADQVLGAFRDQMEDLLREFEARTGKFSYEFFDPNLDTDAASLYDARGPYPAIVFVDEDTKKRHDLFLTNALQTYLFTGLAPIEQNLVTGLLIVTGREQKQVYFLTGHGERDVQDVAQNSAGYGFAVDGIRSENYAVSTLNLFLPDDRARLAEDQENDKVTLVVVAGPTSDLQEEEVQALDDYLLKGGSTLLLLDPDTKPRFRELMARWGVILSEGRILDDLRWDPERKQNIAIRGGQYLNFVPELTQGLDATFYSDVVALVAAEGVAFQPRAQDEEDDDDDETVPNIRGAGLAITSFGSWLSLDASDQERKDGDPFGPFFSAMALIALAPLGEELPEDLSDTKPAQIIVFGDSDFANNKLITNSSNNDLFLNSINWLVGDAPLAGIKPKLNVPRTLVMTTREKKVISYLGWLALPALMALAGGFVWWRGR